MSGDNAAAVNATIGALEDEGRLGDTDQALMAMARTAAAALDMDPGNAALLREYRQTLMALMTAGSGDGDEDTQAFLIAVRTPLVDAPDGTSDGRRSGRRSGGSNGATVDAVATRGRGRRSGAPA